jgi:hypothetical protein
VILGNGCGGVESNHQPCRAMRSRNPRQYGILSLSWALNSAQCGKSVAKGRESWETAGRGVPNLAP